MDYYKISNLIFIATVVFLFAMLIWNGVDNALGQKDFQACLNTTNTCEYCIQKYSEFLTSESLQDYIYTNTKCRNEFFPNTLLDKKTNEE